MDIENEIQIAMNSVADEPLPKEETRIEIVKQQLNFDKLMAMSEALAKSTIIPIHYQNRPENCFVAMDMASRMGLSPMIVMQNLYVIQGKPSWSGSAIASMIRSAPNLRNVMVNYVGIEGTDARGAYITAEHIPTGKTLKGSTVTIAIAKKEGWYQKTGSKWQTMPEMMLAYRAYTWFGRVFVPEIMMGLQSSDEIEDIATTVEKLKVVNPYEAKDITP